MLRGYPFTQIRSAASWRRGSLAPPLLYGFPTASFSSSSCLHHVVGRQSSTVRGVSLPPRGTASLGAIFHSHRFYFSISRPYLLSEFKPPSGGDVKEKPWRAAADDATGATARGVGRDGTPVPSMRDASNVLAASGLTGTIVQPSPTTADVIHRVTLGEKEESAVAHAMAGDGSTSHLVGSSCSSGTRQGDSPAQSHEPATDVAVASAKPPRVASKLPPQDSNPSSSSSGVAGRPALISNGTSSIPIKRVVGRVWSYLWPAGEYKIKALVVGSVLCVLVAKLLKVAVPFWFKTVVDLLAPAATTANAVAVVGPFTVGAFGCVVAYGICRITTSVTEELKTILFAPVGGHASTKLAMEMFDKLHRLDMNYHLNRETGVLCKDLDRGSRAFWTLAYTLLFMVVPTTFEMGLVCLALNTQAGPQFIAIALVAVVSYVSWTLAVTNWRSKYRTRYNTLDSRVGGLIVDSLLNYETVKYFGSEVYESERIRSETTKMNQQLVTLDQTMALLNFGQQVIFVSAGVLSLYLATCGVLAGVLTVGDLVLVDALLMQLYMPLSYLGMIYREVQTSTQNMQAMISLTDQQPIVKEAEGAVKFQYQNGTIELRNVTFEYKKELNRTVLKNLSLLIPGGKTIAFVGPSGSGKSTIFRLLFRFYDPTSGEVLIDGQPIQKVELASLRRKIGVIPQDTVLFNESVMYNIRYGRMSATDTEVIAASKAASLHETVLRMSDGYETSVGERGLKLSGGEKQRVSIARVVLEDCPILLADEATSALDSTTELNVMNTLRNATSRKTSRTIILIAHRLTTVKEADIIFVLDGKGGLAEQGTHEALLRKGGLYAEMWYQQLRDRKQEEEKRDCTTEGVNEADSKAAVME